MPKWMRTFDSAQRRLVFDDPRDGQTSGLTYVEAEIQGLIVKRGGLEETYHFADMADRGVAAHHEPALKIWERLLRRATRIGELSLDHRQFLIVSFWTQPVLQLVFDLNDSSELELWEELEILCLSGGFHFRDLRETN